MTKTIFITGGTRGIGEAIVRASAGNYNVAFSYCENENKANDLVKELESKGSVFAVQCDLSNEESIKEAVAKVIKRFGKIDVLVNNAGISKSGLLIDMKEEDISSLIKVNLEGPILTTKYVLDNMLSKKSGCIINISSIWGQVGGSLETVYSATKAGIIGFTKALFKEVSFSGIRVNAIAPGAIDTDMMKEYSESDLQEVVSSIPAGRLGKPEEIATLVLFVANNEYINGETIGINGGFSI